MLSAHQRNKDARTKRSHSSMQDDFFRLCFDGTISYPPLDTSEFPSDELSDSFLNTITEQNYVATNGPLKDVKGIIWHLRPYLIDLINRRLPLDTVHEKFQRHITEFQFSSRDLMVALLESIDVDLKSMLLSDIAAANRPIPILLNSKYAKMGLSIIASLPYIPKSGLILSIGFSHFGVKSSCKCDKRSLLQGLFPTRGCNFHKWNSTDLCHDDSMDVLFCRDGNFEKLPVTIVDAHINPNSAIPQHYKSLLKNFATNAFAVVISICDFDVKKVETILNLIGENSVTPKIIVFNPTVEITQFEYDELTDDDWVSLDDRKENVESFIEHWADFKVFRVFDSPIVGLIQSHLNLEVSSLYNQLVENMLMGDEHLLKVTWSSVLFD
ncbi:hypothetical protein HK096_009514 [Nowakowskiella sp. JEL0078]|nr:hypothetical protein HK096_009514 [Nowakowskiella sp. JEL0078]